MRRTMTIGTKLLALTVTSALLMLAVGALALYTINSLSTSILEVLSADAELVRQAGLIQVDVLTLRRLEKDMFINLNAPDKLADYDHQFQQAHDAIVTRLSLIDTVAGGKIAQQSELAAAAGADLAGRSGEALDQIVTAVQQVSDLVSSMATVGQEQASGIDQLNRAASRVGEITQVSAAQTEEVASTAQALAAQAEHLEALVGCFRLSQASIEPAGTPAHHVPHLRLARQGA